MKIKMTTIPSPMNKCLNLHKARAKIKTGNKREETISIMPTSKRLLLLSQNRKCSSRSSQLKLLRNTNLRQ